MVGRNDDDDDDHRTGTDADGEIYACDGVATAASAIAVIVSIDVNFMIEQIREERLVLLLAIDYMLLIEITIIIRIMCSDFGFAFIVHAIFALSASRQVRGWSNEAKRVSDMKR